ncbi:MAG: hypothetical protein HRT72_02805, partial [Flavobacteriales bacterium]|nr:hypothetical protein [Flavobacteriales bacterium]
MKKITLVLSLLSSIFSFSQTKDTIYKKYKDINDLKNQFKAIDNETLVYKDETFSYEVEIPEWLELVEKNNLKIMGGKMPAVKGIVNAIAIAGYNKEKFESFE